MSTKLFRLMRTTSLGLVTLLLVGIPPPMAQSPERSSPRPQEQLEERDRLIRQTENLRQAGKLDEAVAAAARALELERKASGDTTAGLAEALSRLAELHELSGDWDRALARRKEALAVRERVDGKEHWRTADARLAVAFAEKVAGLGAPEQAKVQAALGKEEEAARLEARSKFAESERAGLEALETYRAVVGAQSLEVARVWHRIGRVRLGHSDATGAKVSNERALAIRRQAMPPGHLDIAKSLNNLGIAQRELREYTAAKRSHEEALAVRRKALLPGHPDIAQSLNGLGNVQRELREYAAAKRSHEEALAIYRKALPPGHTDIATSLNNLGIVQTMLCEYAAARRSQEEALAIRRQALPAGHPAIAQSLNNLGFLSLASGINREEAGTRLVEASDIYQAEQLRMGIAQAEPEQLVTAALSKGSLQLLINATMTAGIVVDRAYDRVVRAKGSVSAQQRWARQARDAADPETRKLLDRLRDVSREIFGLSMPPLPGENTNSREDVSTHIRNLSDEWGRLEQQLAARSGVYQTIQGRARICGDEVRTALPSDSALIDLVEYLHVEPRAEGSGEPTLERRVVAFVSRPETTGVVAVPLGPSKDFADLIVRWRASSGAGKRPAVGTPDPGSELRKRLWEPLAQYLEGAKVILISPDGPLNGIPWAALPGAKAGTFLVQEYAFAIIPTPQLLPEIVRAKPRPEGESPSLLLAGGIDFGEPKVRASGTPSGNLPELPVYKNLPGTESEVNDLRTEFEDAFADAPRPKVLRKDKATEAAVVAEAATHRFVHLATHGFFADESEQSAVAVEQRGEDLLRGGLHLRPEAAGRHPGLLSGIVFAGVNRSDRGPGEAILTAFEASELELGQVDLLVLSACDTGRGQVAGGEGALGLQRAFQLAGARAVVASLWKVPDEETHLFMREFYRRIWTDKPLSRAEALRQAQLWMLENWKDRSGLERPAGSQGPLPPYYWAAFVLSGDWR
jgi:CHAT domain-containing protein/tetratricopeptide (TPR) repeat protein